MLLGSLLWDQPSNMAEFDEDDDFDDEPLEPPTGTPRNLREPSTGEPALDVSTNSDAPTFRQFLGSLWQ
jgi:hypothetical protein